MQKIGILGGTFNPIHLGHIHLGYACKKNHDLSKVILMPAVRPPHKPDVDLLCFPHRLAMCTLAVEHLPHFTVTDVEKQCGGVGYTMNSLQALRQQFYESELHLIIGSDMLYSLDQWYRYKDLLREYPILTGARHPAEQYKMEEYREKLGSLGQRISIIPLKAVEISSTQIRQAVYTGEDISRYVPQKVKKYIQQYQLYQSMDHVAT